jgi:hypothetical protein
MKLQKKFTFGKQAKREKPIAKQRDGFEAANLRNAQAFIRNPELCGGRESFGYRWAGLVMARLETEARRKELPKCA